MANLLNLSVYSSLSQTPEPYHVYLDMIAYDIEEKIPGNCTAGDFMRVQRVAPDNVVLCGTDCNFQTFTSNNQELVVRFKSDNEITRGGFFFQISGIPVLRAVIPD